MWLVLTIGSHHFIVNYVVCQLKTWTIGQLKTQTIYIYIYIYLYKLKYSIYYSYAPIKPYEQPNHPLTPTISLLFFTLLFINYVSYCYTFFSFSPSFLLFFLSTTLNFNITLPPSLPLPFYFGSFYPHPITINFLFSLPFYIYFPHKKFTTLSFSQDRKSVV